MAQRVIAVGSINVDCQVLAERWPERGETLPVERFLMHGGGKGANVAYIARRLGTDSMVIGHVGSDILRQEALEPLRALGVDVSHVKVAQGNPTGVALIIVHPDGEKEILLATNANDAWSPADADETAGALASAAKGSILAIDLEVPVEVVRRAVTTARANGHRAVLDPSPAGRMADDLYAAADFITPNETEAEMLTGVVVDSVEAAYRAGSILVSRGAGTALVKLGAEGCVVVNSSQRQHIPGFRVKVVDTTGAGDAFAGGLAVALLEGHPAVEAVRFAVAVSALAVTKFGSQPAYPTRAEAEQLLGRATRDRSA